MNQAATSAADPAVPPPRQGPRPLGLHLGIATIACLSSPTGLASLSNGSSGWSESLAEKMAALAENLRSANPDAFKQAVEAVARERLLRFLRAVDGYRLHPYRRALVDPPVAWSEGSTRLLDYSRAPEARNADGPVVLVAPSLINRGYVLDLMHERSFMRALAADGMRPYLVDWGAPGEAERALGLEDYILGRLGGCLDAVRSATGRKPILVGYCMGGVMALALASRRPEELSGLALLASPWDFHADGGVQARTLAGLVAPWLPFFDQLGAMPVDVIQMLFASLDPLLALRKFLAFSNLDPDGAKAEAFVALEDWLNDGVALPAGIARECLLGWYGENTTAKGRWIVGGAPVRPQDLRLPTLAVVPAKDRIVPPASANALAAAIPEAQVMTPPAGHIGMVVGGQRQAQLWDPFAKWAGELKA